MSRHRFEISAGVGAFLILLGLGGRALTARQEPTKATPQPGGGVEKSKVPMPPAFLGESEQRKKAEAALEKLFEAYDLNPHSLPAIPDNPPPYEGAMINYPLVIEPPDLILIEVLEALPGRPISGERLVRPDGMINLGFYGNVHVAGLTPEQAKVKIIKQLRKHLADDLLGLYDIEEEDAVPPTPLPQPNANPFEPDPQPAPKAKKTGGVGSGARPILQIPTSPPGAGRSRNRAHVRLLSSRQEPNEEKRAEPQKQIKVPVQAGNSVNITIEVQDSEKPEENAAPRPSGSANGTPIPPEQSDRVFVDITAYNSKNYYVLGDVAVPGKLPFTGQETVLDALQYAGGLLPTAEPKDIRLVRPARAGKPAKVYNVDLEAINEKGDVTSNYQIFPGDRVVVGRNDVVKKTIELDRLAAPLQTATTAIRQETSMLQSIKSLSPEKQDAVLRELVEFWVNALKQPGGAKFDEQTLRDGLLKKLEAKP